MLLQPIYMELELLEEVHICCMARSLRSLRKVAKLSSKFAPAFRALGVCEIADYVIILILLIANLTN